MPGSQGAQGHHHGSSRSGQNRRDAPGSRFSRPEFSGAPSRYDTLAYHGKMSADSLEGRRPVCHRLLRQREACVIAQRLTPRVTATSAATAKAHHSGRGMMEITTPTYSIRKAQTRPLNT